jgi:hypothetical protein
MWKGIHIFPMRKNSYAAALNYAHVSRESPRNLSTIASSYPHKIATYPHPYVERDLAQRRNTRGT